ncbi:glutamate-rich protein 6B isoform X2 [Notamacropus eugenii]|uniref:glutamate-rich protein 6B isoform X2 n=1 Tax=Notamacropus eugenii TaxID=9315 RepID=UPI003B66FA29
MSKEKKTLPLKVAVSSFRLSLSSLSSSTENFIEQEHKKLLPEILVTEETERPQSPETPESESLDHEEVTLQTPSFAFASSTSSLLPSFSFSSMESVSVQFKSSEPTTSSISSKSEEKDKETAEEDEEKLKSVTKVPSGLSVSSTSFYTEASSSTSISIPVPAPVPPKQPESRLLETKKLIFLHCSTQTKWVMEDDDKNYENIPSVTTSYEKLPIESIEISSAQSQQQTMTTESVKSTVSPLLERGPTSNQETRSDTQGNSQGSRSRSRTYQTVFRCILQELLEREEKAALDIDVSPSARLKQETRRKLAYMFKTNFERYKDVFRRILKRRRPTPTVLANYTDEINIEDYRVIPVPEESPVPSVHELVEMDEEWLEEVTKAHRGFGVPTFYKGPVGKDCVSKPLSIFFPDGTGQIYYPSGNIALIISHTEDSDAFTYMIFKDEEKLNLQALVNNLGHATFYETDENIRMCLSLNVCFYFDAKGRQKAWNWWDPNQHVHAPPYQSVFFNLNPCVDVHIKTQDKVLITFSYYKQKIHLNLGTKVKVKDSETEKKLLSKPILETHKLQKQFQKANSLLKKMKDLCCLTKRDLQTFIKGYPSMSIVEERMRAGKLSKLYTNPT